MQYELSLFKPRYVTHLLVILLMQASVLIMTDVSVVLLLGSLVRAGEHIQQLLSINNIVRTLKSI